MSTQPSISYVNAPYPTKNGQTSSIFFEFFLVQCVQSLKKARLLFEAFRGTWASFFFLCVISNKVAESTSAEIDTYHLEIEWNILH